MVGFMVTSSKKAYAIPRYAVPRAPAPAAGHCWPVPPQETPNTVLSQSLWGLWVLVCTRLVWALWVSLVEMGLDSKYDFTPPPILLCLLCPWMWDISSQLLQHCIADMELSKKKKRTTLKILFKKFSVFLMFILIILQIIFFYVSSVWFIFLLFYYFVSVFMYVSQESKSIFSKFLRCYFYVSYCLNWESVIYLR